MHDERTVLRLAEHVGDDGLLSQSGEKALLHAVQNSIDQAEKAFSLFFDAASKSMAAVPGAGTEISKQALSFTEQNLKSAFEHARKLVHATDLQEAMRIQSEFLRSQFTSAGEHMRNITGEVMSATKDLTKGRS